MSVGENIRRYRKLRGMTQAQLWAEKRAQLENGEIDDSEYEDWKASL